MLGKYNPDKARELLTIIIHVTFADYKVTVDNLADLLECGVSTVNRHLGTLRSENISIHSCGYKGVIITEEITDEIFKDLLSEYIIAEFSSITAGNKFDHSELYFILQDKNFMKLLHCFAAKLNVTIFTETDNKEKLSFRGNLIDLTRINGKLIVSLKVKDEVMKIDFDDISFLSIMEDQNIFSSLVDTSPCYLRDRNAQYSQTTDHVILEDVEYEETISINFSKRKIYTIKNHNREVILSLF